MKLPHSFTLESICQNSFSTTGQGGSPGWVAGVDRQAGSRDGKKLKIRHICLAFSFDIIVLFDTSDTPTKRNMDQIKFKNKTIND